MDVIEAILRKGFFYFCKLFFKWYCPLTIEGRDNLPTPPFMLCSNHSSHMDTPVLMLAANQHFHDFGMLAAKDYFFDHHSRNKIVTAMMNLIPISRQCTRETLAENLKLCKAFLEKPNRNLIIYPEGKRSLDGKIHSFKRGPAMIAGELNIPIVPVYIQGTFEALKKGTFFPRKKRVHVIIGKSMMIPSNPSRDFTQTLEKNIRELAKEPS